MLFRLDSHWVKHRNNAPRSPFPPKCVPSPLGSFLLFRLVAQGLLRSWLQLQQEGWKVPAPIPHLFYFLVFRALSWLVEEVDLHPVRLGETQEPQFPISQASALGGRLLYRGWCCHWAPSIRSWFHAPESNWKETIYCPESVAKFKRGKSSGTTLYSVFPVGTPISVQTWLAI